MGGGSTPSQPPPASAPCPPPPPSPAATPSSRSATASRPSPASSRSRDASAWMFTSRTVASRPRSPASMASKQPVKEDGFEALYSRLEQAVTKLEQGGLTLEASLALYEEGMQIARRCQDAPQQAELRITRHS